jgi:hypothetical protein
MRKVYNILTGLPRHKSFIKRVAGWLTVTGFFIVVVSACQNVIKDGPTPKLGQNPYDTVKRPDDSKLHYVVDSSSIMGVHALVFSKKCAVPACHDGSFEPDYRTIASAYTTIVYAPSIKNDAKKTFTYRVVPFDTAKSWLHYRITTNDKVLGRMPLYDTLAKWQISLITKWILNGARDIFGNTPGLPNAEPAMLGIVAFLPDLKNYRVDTIRGKSVIYPFLIPKNTKADIWFGLYDDKNLPTQFTVNQVKFSTDAVNFSNPVTMNLTVDNAPSSFPGFDKKPYPFYDHVQINTSTFKPGDLVFMRVYVKDADHANATEIPKASANFALQSYFSFYVGM